MRGVRVLANGEPASFFVPDHLVRVEPEVDGIASDSRMLSIEDEIILHVPVRGYLRFLPGIFHGEGPVERRSITRAGATNALQRAGRNELARPDEVRFQEEQDEFLKRFPTALIEFYAPW